ncbi:CynX/NimT family MFS transporter [Lacicoccus alkaliphilus]|uniref:MFS transporter, CP family, cyanate transporter n=1 Tax=Lacicoccus alkaliphilus DSM 16010 TaxID=1123231 RepID=A0A1M7CTB3_9BACL|nr:MFS transporter [Salinicoccus alkaliphilus]SHL70333.1 MFS transporter, CP family, cyanate transporter [Salinicoccus alkaliphilus DSM 16010]
MSEIQNSQKFRNNILLVIGIIAVAAMLRAPLTAVGPVINEIRDDLMISNTVAGLLTTIPLLTFAAVSPFVSKAVARFTMPVTIFYAIILLIASLYIRTIGTLEWFMVGTVLLGVAISVGNVTLPSYAKWKFPLQVGVVTAIYSSTMNLTAGVGSGVSVPLAEIGGGYGLSLTIWVAFGIVALIVWIPQLKSAGEGMRAAGKRVEEVPKRRMSQSKMAWAIAVMFALQSTTFYTNAAWLPSILMDKGLSPEAAGYFFMFCQFAQLPMTFLFPILASRVDSQRSIVAAITGLLLAGYLLLFAETPGLLIFSMIFIGFGTGAAFSTCMLLFSMKARTDAGSISLSGFGQSIGYLLAAIGPFLMGYLFDATGSWTPALISYLVIVVMFFGAGMVATRKFHIEDELEEKV